MKNNDFLNFFNDIIINNNAQSSKINPADELDAMWRDYHDYINELKEDGYRVYVNETGKHKVIK